MTNGDGNQVSWTERKRQVLELIARGKTNGEIAQTLGVSLAGAKWHVSEVLSILGVESREEAAEYWRHQRSLGARASRTLRGIGHALLTMKTVAAASGVTAVFGGAVVVVGLSHDGSPLAPVGFGAETVLPRPSPERLQYLDIVTIDLGAGRTATLGASLGEDLCFRESGIGEPRISQTYGCFGSKQAYSPSLLSGFGLSRPAHFWGTTPLEADSVVIDVYSGPQVRPALVLPDPSLGLHVKVWAAALPKAEDVARITSYDEHGNVLETRNLYDPPGTPPRAQITAPLSHLVQIGSFRDDGSFGNFDPSSSRAGAIARPEGGTYRFRIEHDGTRPLALHLWCQTGVMSLNWIEGPDSSGNGGISANIPPNSAGCFFLASGGDGAYRISALPN